MTARPWRARREPARCGCWPRSALVFAIAAVLVPAMPQPLSYHAFADCRTIWSIPNFFNVLSNLPFLVGGGLGLRLIWHGGGAFVDGREQLPYLVFFLGALLTSLGSAYYHLAPDNPRLVWDRLPMTLGFAGLVAAARRRTRRTSGSDCARCGRCWPSERARSSTGTPPSAWAPATSFLTPPTRAGPILAIVLLIALFPARRYSHGALLLWAAGWYGLAKVFETFDLAIYRLLGGIMSGHTIKHLLAAGAVFAIVRQLRLRRALPVSTLDRSA